MVIKSYKDYKFVRFKKSTNSNKKYDCILINKITGRQSKISFGAKKYQQYKDTTKLGLYSHLDHLDKKRRDRYRKRHYGEGDINKKYSAGYLSWHFLW